MHMLTDQQLLHANRTSPFAEAEAALRFQTTYKKCFADDVNAAQTANPDYFAGADKSHHLKGSLHKDSFTEDVVSRPISGRGGARGEFTRWPGESGSKYCVSVFVDEYAKWGSHPSLPAPSHATASGTS
eukprot:jgi/Chrzof1/13941/Cz08g18190.t1